MQSCVAGDYRAQTASPPTGAAGEKEERRKQPREAVDTAARVKVINPVLSIGPAAFARVLNRSAGGLKVQVPAPVFVGALVQVRMPGEILLGEVRYCSSHGSEFDIGVRLVD